MPSNHLILCHPLLLLPSPFPASGSFLMNQFFTSGGQSIGVSALASVLPVNIQDYFPLVWAQKQVQCRKNFTENWREWEQGWALRSFLIFFLPSLPSSLPLPLSRAQIVLMATERSICSCRCLETSLVPGVGGREPSLLLGQEARRLLDGPMVWGGLCMVWFGGVCSKVAHISHIKHIWAWEGQERWSDVCTEALCGRPWCLCGGPGGGPAGSTCPRGRAQAAPAQGSQRGAGTGCSETHTQALQWAHPDRGLFLSHPAWEVWFQEGDILHKKDRRRATPGVMMRGDEPQPWGGDARRPPAPEPKHPPASPGVLAGSPAPPWEASRRAALPLLRSKQSRSPSHKLKSLLTAAIKQLN